jgi:ABC-2 type transport system permease protein
VFDAARYPVDFFKGGVRTFLTFVVPVAFVTSIPADALLGRSNPWLLLLAPVLAASTLLASHLFWNYALRHYGSASS